MEDKVQLLEMKTPVGMVVVTNYGYFQVLIHGFVVPASVSILVEDSAGQGELEINADMCQSKRASMWCIIGNESAQASWWGILVLSVHGLVDKTS